MMNEYKYRLLVIYLLALAVSALAFLIVNAIRSRKLGELVYASDDGRYFKSGVFYLFRIAMFVLAALYLIFYRSETADRLMSLLLVFMAVITVQFATRPLMKMKETGLYENGFRCLSGMRLYDECEEYSFIKDNDSTYRVSFALKPAWLKRGNDLYIDMDRKKDYQKFLVKKLKQKE